MSSAAASSLSVKWVNRQSGAILKDLYCIRLFFKTADNSCKFFGETVAHSSVRCVLESHTISISRGQRSES